MYLYPEFYLLVFANNNKQHDKLVTSVDWAPQSNRIVTCSQDVPHSQPFRLNFECANSSEMHMFGSPRVMERGSRLLCFSV